ncbi:MAG: hypothetical protein KKF52_00575, partial [Nanoarchaeota archaeon]|nr:hypothetical protein [Nanoarchaeota archaeon]
ITDSKLKTIKLPELLTEKAIKLEKKFNLNADLAKELIKEDIDIESYVKQFSKIDVKLLATILTAYPKDLKSRLNLDSSKLTKEHYFEIFTLLNKGEISKEAVIELMADAASGKKIDASRFKNVSEDSLKKELEKIVAKNKGASLNALMGEAMKHFRGKADGQRIMEILKTLI